MKSKLTILMTVLLLAVGWSSTASAQNLPQGMLKTTKKVSASSLIVPTSTGTDALMNAPQQEPTRATGVSSVVKPKSYYQQFKYNWTDGDNNQTYTNVDPTEPASNPYQIYELLRFVYGNPNFPGPTYSAYTPGNQREDEVYYGPIAGGWNITSGSGTASATTHDITITTSSYYPTMTSITVYDSNDNVLASWDAATAISNGDYNYTYDSNYNTVYYFILPTGWTKDFNYFYYWNLGTSSDPIPAGYTGSGATGTGTITIPYTLLNGTTDNVKVVINASHDWETGDTGSETQTITVNGVTQTLTTELADYTWNDVVVYEAPQAGGFVQGTVVAPDPSLDGYTVVLVALKDRAEMSLETELWPANSTHFETKAQLITYFRNNIEYVRLLTDGLRIGEVSDKTSGTVFNADGRLNRFFFLGKGQARKKAPRIQAFIDQGGTIRFSSFTVNGTTYTNVNYQDWFGEDVPFEEMFEQFSPTSTTVSDASQTTDLFDKLKEGNVYMVQHDCGSVMQAEHEFSLAGKDGTDHFAFSGLNFFVPDYRLLFWTAKDTVDGTPYTVDGRDNVPYQSANTSYTTPGGSHGSNYSGIYDLGNSYYYPTWWSDWSAYYAVYNPDYAPLVGIYRIKLDATATQVGTTHNPDNHNYNVTLTWVSSLNEMTGHEVAQTYTMYLVDENGNRTPLEPEGVKFYDINGNELSADNQNPFHVCQAVYAVPQNEHSYTIEYQVDGVADQGPAFHATSNRASVVIPGWNDFVGLKLDHHESDFIITSETVRDNWYRNFLAMVNEDIYNGLTISKITGYNPDGEQNTPMNKFNLYRYTYDDNGQPKDYIKVATITFDQATADQVHYTITYENQEIEDYTLTYKEGNQTYTVNNAYELENLEVPVSGWVRVKGNGDIVIWPNSYSVNIKSIIIKNGNTTIASWNASSANVAQQTAGLPTSPYKWGTSPGSKFLPYITSTGSEKVCYMEGGGYLYIPGILNDYPNATVTIEAFGEAGNVNRISVNDASQDIDAVAGGTTYDWSGLNGNAKAPKRDNNSSRKDDMHNNATNDINRR